MRRECLTCRTTGIRCNTLMDDDYQLELSTDCENVCARGSGLLVLDAICTGMTASLFPMRSIPTTISTRMYKYHSTGSFKCSARVGHVLKS
ncbi:hypothetical protein MPTK1_5g12450 [Marchantia polymorpha subsp. ruderalis]|uniref:Uncharacterized protein n=2 Tax=Marchantia polymorpha TaxID=3197 RepID=A0AAF6BHL6_MARPO|nr:hypothetical protein MARPO_0092s0061 [Marchantia polymorpha]BBN11500.1 hypothetical protein Mp_5g12450 [Marchantia polymorpha subsp. ruderalis]|eukprot:PTQ33100.1 hypothetical protein MARPO_0092s0061 [Marchantia polymorpha]